MLLVIDVGNTNISYGVFDGTTLLHHVRTESARARTADEYAVLVHQMLAMRGVGGLGGSGTVGAAIGSPAIGPPIDDAIVASVVPSLTDTMVAMVRRAFAREAMVVGPGIRTGMPILYEDPREVGADRIVNAVAAYEWLRKNDGPSPKSGLIVVDFGTATTFDCVSPKGEYLGGVITPGVQISAEALFSRAARLHRVEIAVPPRVLGKNPVQSMQSGIVFGYAALVDGLCARLVKDLGHPCRVLATGGLARDNDPHQPPNEQFHDGARGGKSPVHP
ncbi:MAG: type III pantothenate kinase, partial [Polyangiaceae bacterium]